ncbi:MAG: DUF2868 domain-containing protein [Gammaproteobacteria bacterium]|nr:DUF2868 domain-containing protein [Gammaproteobacteria bacterium]
MHHERTLFQDAIDIPIWLEADRETPYARRIERDRVRDASTPASPVARIRQWWMLIPNPPDVGGRLQRGRRVIGLSMVALGAAAGAGVAAAVLRYDGTHPVNAITAFSVLVGVQWVLIALTLLLLPKAVPGLRGLQSALGQLNPAAIAASLYRRFGAAQLPEHVRDLLRWHVGRAAASRFAKWQVLHWSQTAAVAFNTGAVVTALVLVTFTDLAFGWSSTLDLSAQELHTWIAMLAKPWAGIVPAAVPSPELIDASRFFASSSPPPSSVRRNPTSAGGRSCWLRPSSTRWYPAFSCGSSRASNSSAQRAACCWKIRGWSHCSTACPRRHWRRRQPRMKIPGDSMSLYRAAMTVRAQVAP